MLNVPPKREFPCFPNPGTYHVFPSSPLLWAMRRLYLTLQPILMGPQILASTPKVFPSSDSCRIHLCFVWRGGAPDGICHLRTSQVIFVGSESISQTTIETVDVMLVLH